MSITHTNRKGVTYTLYQGRTRTGKPRYHFGRDGGEGQPVAVVPLGYTISESVNGVVSLVKDRPSPIWPEELAAVESAIGRHPAAHRYRAVAKQKLIEIYERVGPDYAETLHKAGLAMGRSRSAIAEQLQNLEERDARFEPVLRLTLLDPERRLFGAERWCYLGSIDGWLMLGRTGSATNLADGLVPTLGTDNFYDL
jgi:hypothetical protein